MTSEIYEYKEDKIMRRLNALLITLLCMCCIFGGTTVLANTGVLAKITTQTFFWENERIELPAYNINGNNYVKLRDIAEVFGVEVEYDAETNSVHMGTESAETIIDGEAFAREDFSLDANPDIFNDIYTRDAYNAIRQSIVDIEKITENADEGGYNAKYEYAHFVDGSFSFESSGKTITAMQSVVSCIRGYYTFSFGYEPTVTNLYEYPGYRICIPQVHRHFSPANVATESFVLGIKELDARDKVRKIAKYISDRIVYKDADVAGINDVFTSEKPVNGICGTYADAFVYLCQRASIPCVAVQDDTHAWNEVYVDRVWYATDISYYDIARTDAALFPISFIRKDKNIAKTQFAKELLVPSSTK